MSKMIHAAERLGRDVVTNAVTTPVVNNSAYFFKNPTSTIFEEKLSELKTRICIEFVLSKMGIMTYVINPADVGALESTLE
ncbi:hypothetical protein KIW84_072518 [Lathyrus oleraceus]|uniref:Uncharacterized protein n=1 Tax=Pisum sativum TaxID=3888 RepID=A0A9D4VLP7_PEA|nr:hypothetical protein KIW84_072518 [Pisum sativum]